jgi:hypothetical protein
MTIGTVYNPMSKGRGYVVELSNARLQLRAL